MYLSPLQVFVFDVVFCQLLFRANCVSVQSCFVPRSFAVATFINGHSHMLFSLLTCNISL